MPADFANQKFLGKSAVDPKYCHLFVELFTCKVYTYPMKSRKFMLKKMYDLYDDEAKKIENDETSNWPRIKIKQK